MNTFRQAYFLRLLYGHEIVDGVWAKGALKLSTQRTSIRTKNTLIFKRRTTSRGRDAETYDLKLPDFPFIEPWSLAWFLIFEMNFSFQNFQNFKGTITISLRNLRSCMRSCKPSSPINFKWVEKWYWKLKCKVYLELLAPPLPGFLPWSNSKCLRK